MLSPRAVRAGLLGSALAVLTLAGHTAAGGALDPLGIGIVAVLSTALAAALSTRAMGLPALIAVLLAGQGFLHLVVSLSVAHPHGTTGVSSAGTSSTAMVAGHAVAGVMAALLIAYADDLAARWSRLGATLLGSALRLPSTAIAMAPVNPTAALDDRLPGWQLRHLLSHRGPPASCSPA